jgi:putative DNA-invertase from lambdoid prophage Rac
MALGRLPTPQPRCYGYARVSTDQQRDSGISLDEQQRKIEARAVEMGWQLEHVFVDAAVSGSIPLSRRPEGARLLDTVRPGDIVVAAKMDRCFRSAHDALSVIEDFKRKKISLWLLDLGNDCSGNGISQLILTVLAAVAEFERGLISERQKDTKRNLRRAGKHQGGRRPFGFQYGPDNGGKARVLVPDPVEQQAVADMLALRQGGATLFAIRDELRQRGLRVSHQTVANILARQEAGGP